MLCFLIMFYLENSDRFVIEGFMAKKQVLDELILKIL